MYNMTLVPLFVNRAPPPPPNPTPTPSPAFSILVNPLKFNFLCVELDNIV